MNNKLLLIAVLGVANTGQSVKAQQSRVQNPNSGDLRFGIRGNLTPSTRNGNSWISYGVQLQVKIARRFNSEWFADYYPAASSRTGERKDLHIGGIALYYPMHEIYTGKVYTPYFSIGTNYTYTESSAKVRIKKPEQQADIRRWGFGLIAGMGILLHVSPKFDVGLVSQYLGQVGAQFKSVKTTVTAPDTFSVQSPDTGVNYEGQIIFCMSVNYALGDLW